MFLFNDVIAMLNATKWHATDAIAAPFTPILGIGTKIKFKINFIITPHPSAIAGIANLPYPCSAPFIVWSSIVNIIVSELICNITEPALAFGNSKFNIGPAKMHIPIVQGSPINIDISNENDVLLVIVCSSLLAFAAEIAGTNAVANATFIDSGKLVSISTFPPKYSILCYCHIFWHKIF